MYKTRIATLNEFGNLKPVWNRLVLQMQYPVVFLTWEWVYTWWEHFGGRNREPVILLVSEGEEIRGILPLYSERILLENYWLNGKILTHCSATDLYPDHADLIAAPEHAHACLDSLFEFLFAEYRAWDVLRVPMVVSPSLFLDWLSTRADRRPDIDFDVEQASVARYIPISGTFENFLGRFDKKQRYNLRSRAKKLYEEHGVRYSTHDDDAVKALRGVFELHRQRAERKGIRSTFDESKISQYHEALAGRIRPEGWLSLRSLMSGEKVIAASYNFEFAGRVFSYQKGFDTDWERLGPGTVLMYELIREAFSNGRTEYNFLQGDESYKSVWTQESRTLSNVNVYNNSLQGHLARSGYRFKRTVKRTLGKQSEPRVESSGAS